MAGLDFNAKQPHPSPVQHAPSISTSISISAGLRGKSHSSGQVHFWAHSPSFFPPHKHSSFWLNLLLYLFSYSPISRYTRRYTFVAT
ncbi:Uncharacterized protein HZ326_15963 [Fusarium oxysporum f. sp. albedinis]|nr:Uncharacterized protein HZ326_15963 [Fusarium oxysporum f. sp. albedinis]